MITLGANSTFPLLKGDVVEIRVSGGKGWGNPHERDRDLVARDLEDEIITKEDARNIYGLKILQEASN